MKITFYSIWACPRCALTRKHLKELEKGFPEMELTFIDALMNPVSTYKNGIRMVPALSGEKIISGIFISKDKIRDFLISEQKAQSNTQYSSIG